MSKERIAKVIARSGMASRRKAESIVEAGDVRVNGKVLRDVATKVDPAKDKIVVRGRRLHFDESVTIALNKPRGYVTTKSDAHARKTVYDLLPKKYSRLHSVGRLDKETSGLLLFTNDGSLTYQITHPKFEVRKKYQVTIRGKLKQKDIDQLRKGLSLPEFDVSPCEVEDIAFDANRKSTRFVLVIGEGKKREIRKIMEHFSYDLSRLHRTHIGDLGLRGIKMGQVRKLTEKEIKKVLK